MMGGKVLTNYGQDEFEEEVLALFHKIGPEHREDFISLLRKCAAFEEQTPSVPEQSFSIAL